MLGTVAERFNSSCECGRELSVDEEAQSSVPKYRMVVLSGRELQDCCDIVGLKIGIVRENLLASSTGEIGRASCRERV